MATVFDWQLSMITILWKKLTTAFNLSSIMPPSLPFLLSFALFFLSSTYPLFLRGCCWAEHLWAILWPQHLLLPWCLSNCAKQGANGRKLQWERDTAGSQEKSLPSNHRRLFSENGKSCEEVIYESFRSYRWILLRSVIFPLFCQNAPHGAELPVYFGIIKPFNY